jgi:branched-chain amino acid transport system permease protein
MALETAIQLSVAGAAIGMVYALVALGFILVWNAVGVINFAQAEFAMVPAFVLAVLLTTVHLRMWLAIPGTLLFAIVLGMLFSRFVYHPLRRRPMIGVIIATIGVSLFLRNIVLAVFGAEPRSVKPLLEGTTVLLGVTLNKQYLVVIVVAVLLLVFQYLLFTRTMVGRQLQATAQNPDMAALLGINTGRMIEATFAYSAALAAVAGILVAPLFGVTTDLGVLIALKAFAATVIGGFGSIPGAVLGALLLGLTETFGATYVSSEFKDAFAFIILILVLLVLPQGIFGERVSQKA